MSPKSSNGVFADSSVLVTAFSFNDPSQPTALKFLLGCRDELVVSVLAEVEIARALERKALPIAVQAEATHLLADSRVVELTGEIRKLAATLKPASMRTLDAIHVATALMAGVSEFATFDVRQQVAAEEAGLALAQVR